MAEVFALWLLPLCEAYPMNASCLVILYFWKESKHARFQICELLACASALSAWILPFFDPALGQLRSGMKAETLVALLLAPSSCAYAAGLLLCGLGVSYKSQGGTLGCCAPPALNFGVSALLLKALIQLVASLAVSPGRPESWLLLPVLVLLLLWVRCASAAPLRRALEVHDTLSVLALYGAISGAAAALTGGFIYGELDEWSPERRALYLAVAVTHFWGMRALGVRGAESRGYESLPPDESPTADSAGRLQLASERLSSAPSKALQMAELATTVGRGSSAAAPTAAPGQRQAAAKDSPPSPLLRFNEAPAARSVDDDAKIEEQLFAHALAPLQLAPAAEGLDPLGSEGPEWGSIWPEAAAATEVDGLSAAPPQFDADFEEIMRRFEEDDRMRHTLDLPQEDPSNVPTAAPVLEDTRPPAVLEFDAQALLDAGCGGGDEEDELLREIENI